MGPTRLNCLIEQLDNVSIIWPGPGGICRRGIHTATHRPAPTQSHIHSPTHVQKAVHLCGYLKESVSSQTCSVFSKSNVCGSVCACLLFVVYVRRANVKPVNHTPIFISLMFFHVCLSLSFLPSLISLQRAVHSLTDVLFHH